MPDAPAGAQSTNVPLDPQYDHWIDRYEVKQGRLFQHLFTTVKPYRRVDVVAEVDTLARSGAFVSRSDGFNREFLLNDSWEWTRGHNSDSRKPVLNQFYKKKSDFWHVQTADFDLHVNPVLVGQVGTDTGLDQPLFINTRGVEMRGWVDGKIGFYTLLTENQMRLPSFARDVFSNPVVPHEGFWKTFKETGVDFFHARGYIDFRISRHVGMQFGQDRLFVGNGMRSLIFSDFAPPHLFWRTQMRVWKINYLFQVNRMVAEPAMTSNGSRGGIRYPEKFVMFHHASINIGKKLNIGFFESVVSSPRDSINNNTFDISYLNPVIFFRAIETQFGSAGDNVLLGADFKWLMWPRMQLYGQAVIDEFLLEELRAGNGWWANKYALQLGARYVDVLGIANLDLQSEVNIVRPYTYSHNTAYGNYSHYWQPIAHPLGANFREWVTVVRYQPLPRLALTGKYIQALRGRDRSDTNFGTDVLKNSRTRENSYGNAIGQGLADQLSHVNFTASYQVKHNLFVDFTFAHRSSRVAPPPDVLPPGVTVPASSDATLISAAVRWNLAARLYDY